MGVLSSKGQESAPFELLIAVIIMIFVMMFANGLIPFSILLTSSIVQDGHGMLPLFSYTVKDSVLIKMFNLVFAIVIGLPLFLLGF